MKTFLLALRHISFDWWSAFVVWIGFVIAFWLIGMNSYGKVVCICITVFCAFRMVREGHFAFRRLINDGDKRGQIAISENDRKRRRQRGYNEEENEDWRG